MRRARRREAALESRRQHVLEVGAEVLGDQPAHVLAVGDAHLAQRHSLVLPEVEVDLVAAPDELALAVDEIRLARIDHYPHAHTGQQQRRNAAEGQALTQDQPGKKHDKYR